MFALAFLIGLYANCLLVFGLLSLYYSPFLAGFTFLYFFIAVSAWPLYDEKVDLIYIRREIVGHIRDHTTWALIIIASLGIMLIGALAPETAFDSLWYHLTLPKIYLAEHGIRYFSGGLLHYSTTPKLVELLYIPAIALHSETVAKLIHLSFGILTGLVIYLVARRYTDRYFGIIALVIFFGNIVVLWEATTTFVDLGRAFFEIMAFWGLIEFIKTKEKKWLIESALLVGLAIQTKLIGVTTLGVYCLLLIIFSQPLPLIKRLVYGVQYVLLALLIPLPWFIFSFVHTGNPVYPLFSPYLAGLPNPSMHFPEILISPIMIFLTSPDPLSPIYLLVLPLFFLVRKKLSTSEKVLFTGVVLVIIAWMLTPQTGGGRFMLAYLPLLSVAVVVILYKIKSKTALLRSTLLATVIVSGISLVYRSVASTQYFPVVIGLESKQEFLTENLNFSFGDFYDIEGQFKNYIKPSSTVLLYGFHNLYYMDVPFIDSSWVRKGDRFDFIAVQNSSLPSRFKYWTPVYKNVKTGVTLYTANQIWTY